VATPAHDRDRSPPTRAGAPEALFFALVLVLGFAAAATTVARLRTDTPLRADASHTASAPALPAWLDGSASARLTEAFDRQLVFRPLARNVWGAGAWALLRSGRAGVVVGRDGWLFSDEEFETPPDAAALFDANVDAIARVRRALAERGIGLVVAPVPAKARVESAQLGARRLPRAVAGRYEHFLRELRAQDVPAPDLLAALRRARSRAAVFLRSDTHWTPAGAEAAARSVAAVLRRRVEIPPARSARFDTRIIGEADRTGDLSRFIATGAVARALGIAPERVERRVTSPAASPGTGRADATLFDTPDLPIALVGTSYSHDPLWNFAGALREHAFADVVDRSETGLGPLAPMVALLEALAAGAAPPIAVVWEYPERYLSQPLGERRSLGARLAAASAPLPPGTSPFDCTRPPAERAPVDFVPARGRAGALLRAADATADFSLSPRARRGMQQLAAALAERGTTLVAVLPPTRGLMPGDLFPAHATGIAAIDRFDGAAALASWNARIDALRALGVVVPDLLTRVRARRGERRFWMLRDHHWRPQGARMTARAVAAEVGDLLERRGVTRNESRSRWLRSDFETGSLGERLERACGNVLPRESVDRYASEDPSRSAAQALLADVATPRVVLAGTSFSRMKNRADPFHFAGFLREALHADVLNVSAQGGMHGAIEAYLRSDAFRESPPVLLVWEMAGNNRFGSYPSFFRQALAAIEGPCNLDEATAHARVTLPREPGAAATRLLTLPAAADTAGGPAPDRLQLDIDDPDLLAFDVVLHFADGRREVAHVERFDGLPNDGRFLLRLAGPTAPDAGGAAKGSDEPEAAMPATGARRAGSALRAISLRTPAAADAAGVAPVAPTPAVRVAARLCAPPR